MPVCRLAHDLEGLKTALLLIDVINDLDFPQGRRLLRHALPAARRIVGLKKRAKAARAPIIYVNDNFGRWRSDFRRQVAHCLREGCLGRDVARLLAPDEEDFFVLKPKHSGFYSTTLDILLKSLRVDTVVLTGFATDICVLYTANDAYMRDYRIVVASDGVAAEQASWNRAALAQMQRLGADVRPASRIRFGKVSR
jgi:nicotinamidase-related amidase